MPQASRVARATGVPPTLDDVFLALTGRTLREAGEGEPTDEDETTPEKPSRMPRTARRDAGASDKTGAKR